MPQPLAPDIEQRLAREFDGDDLAAVRQLLLEYRDPFDRTSDRVLRCIVHLGAGDVDTFLHCLGQARMDSRDVIYWAEYDANDVQVRDFNKPFAGEP